jgi:CubicO group peptidase (beta-lactamase class C family)
MLLQNLQDLDGVVEAILRDARIPGAALSIVVGDEVVFAKGYGYCDVELRLPMRPTTLYPIASTTKAINATLLGMLVDEGHLGWDVPVQSYLPTFRLGDPIVSAQVTVRDLITMRTGLPRHDWLWIDNSTNRGDLVERLRYLELSSGLRERYQYNNLTVTASGYLAEQVTGRSWEDLVRERILEPLGMLDSTCVLPPADKVTRSYHENASREIILTRPLSAEVTAPSGGALYSTIVDMSRWLTFNIQGGKIKGRQLVQSRTLSEIHSPQMVIGTGLTGQSPDATYAMGWIVDTYNGHARLSHGGCLNDVNSEVTVFPQHNLGFVSFCNLNGPVLPRLLTQHAFGLLMDVPAGETVQDRLEIYERQIEEVRLRAHAVPRVKNTAPSHSLDAYVGMYTHPGYGEIKIHLDGKELVLRRRRVVLPLQHWHFDAWVARDNDSFPIHYEHAFDRTSRLLFETNADGQIGSLYVRLEPAVAPIRFDKVPVCDQPNSSGHAH